MEVPTNGNEALYKYVKCCEGQTLPDDAVKAGRQGEETYYHVRGKIPNGLTIPGSVALTSSTLKMGVAYISHLEIAHKVPIYEVLTTRCPTSYVECRPGDKPPEGAVIGGEDHGPSYHARVKVTDGVFRPGKVGVPSKDHVKLKSACIPIDGKEPRFEEFEVLVISDEITDVSFRIDQGKMTEKRPKVLAELTNKNTSNELQVIDLEFSESISHSSSFSSTDGASITVGTKFKTGIPFIAEGEIKMEASLSHEHTWEKETTTTQTFSERFAVKAAPQTTVKCQALVKESKMDVPYTITFKSGKTSSGIWEGISAWSVHASYREL